VREDADDMLEECQVGYQVRYTRLAWKSVVAAKANVVNKRRNRAARRGNDRMIRNQLCSVAVEAECFETRQMFAFSTWMLSLIEAVVEAQEKV
jgi:hypothetical protein